MEELNFSCYNPRHVYIANVMEFNAPYNTNFLKIKVILLSDLQVAVNELRHRTSSIANNSTI